ncbi:MAG: YbjQ family protein [Firmicutes bacterium]|nr:YbjQ family protein [Bacillota bacterium]MBQ6810507.1 YbjQ family protein [Bacillota bacterium]
MLMTTTDVIPGKAYTVLGVVMGSFVNSKNIGHDIGASFKTLVGGELKSYTKMMDEARDQAFSKMEANARAIGADAIIGIRITSSAMMQGASEVLAYGTAIKWA